MTPNRLAIFDGICGEIGCRDETASGLLESANLLCHGALVEAGRIFRNTGECGGEQRLFEGIARLIKIAVALKDVCGKGEFGEFLTAQSPSFFRRENKAIGGKTDGRSHVLSKGELAEVLLRVRQSGNRAGNTRSLIADQRHIGNHVAFGVEVHITAGSGWCHFAVIEEVGFTILFSDQHKAAAAYVASRGIDDRQGKANGYSCVDCIATLFENGDASIRRFVVDGDDHGVFGACGA
jgi:hypothetical protein